MKYNIKVKMRWKLRKNFLPKVRLNKILTSFVLNLPLFGFYHFIYFRFLSKRFIALKHLSFTSADFEKKIFWIYWDHGLQLAELYYTLLLFLCWMEHSCSRSLHVFNVFKLKLIDYQRDDCDKLYVIK